MFNDINTHNNIIEPHQLIATPSNTLNHICTSLKKHIDELYEKGSKLLKWEYILKLYNPYEYIHNTLPGSDEKICKQNAKSINYFKCCEIMQNFHLIDIDDNKKMKKIRTFIFDDDYGSFIKGICDMRKTKTVEDIHYYGNWNKSLNKDIVQTYTSVNVIYDIQDITHTQDLQYMSENYGNTMHLVVGNLCGDVKCMLLQLFYGVILQQYEGNFVLRISDFNYSIVKECLYFLGSFYNKIFVYKPCTTNVVNTEKYIICKDFRYHNTTQYTSKFINMIPIILENDVNSILSIQVPSFFSSKIDEINIILGRGLLHALNDIIKLCGNDRCSDHKYFEKLKNNNITKCIQWCIKYKMPYNYNKQPQKELIVEV
jgi:hypothetical protein